MNSKKNINQSKTEFLFESDAEKALLKQATTRKPKVYKYIILNSIIICIIFISLFTSLSYYEQKTLLNIRASTIIDSTYNNTINEELYNNDNSLKEFNNSYADKYHIIINNANVITEEIISNYNQVTVNDNIFGSIKLEEETYNHYLMLKENLLKRGYYINIRNGFRSLKKSEIIYKEYEIEKGLDYAKKYVTKPGASEHNVGLALDITISTDKYSLKTDYNSNEYFYLENIAHLYGFIIRYPKDKENITGYSYEPWHLRYVGKDLAKYLKKNDLTLEEYYEINNKG